MRPPELTEAQMKALEWPFTIRTAADGRIEYGPELRRYYHDITKTLRGQPTRARFRNSHLHLFARLSPFLADSLAQLLCIGLATRMVPELARPLLLVQIAKPDGGLRPLSVLHDFYATMAAAVQKAMNHAIDKSGILPAYLRAYRPGLGTPQAAAVLAACVEDARRRLATLFIHLDDFAKFYDSVAPWAAQVSLGAAGFPLQGFREFAAESVFRRVMYILTSVGITGPTPRASGLMQGCANACGQVNPVVLPLHLLWRLADPANQSIGPLGAYRLPALRGIFSLAGRVWGQLRGYPHLRGRRQWSARAGAIRSESYCDDNVRFQQRLVRVVQSVVYFGYFSAVLGIGRRDDKAFVLAINAQHERQCPDCAATPLAPAAEPCDCCRRARAFLDRHCEATRACIRSLSHDRDLGAAITMKIQITDKPQAIKYLGLHVHSTDPEPLHGVKKATATGISLAETINRATTLAQFAWAYAMCCATKLLYLALPGRTGRKEAIALDINAISRARKLARMPKGDPPHPLVLPADDRSGGYGFQSAEKSRTKELAGSLEAQLNGSDETAQRVGIASIYSAQRYQLRVWLALKRNRGRTRCPEKRRTAIEPDNHTAMAIADLARKSIHLRHQDDELIGRMLDALEASDPRIQPYGSKAAAPDYLMPQGSPRRLRYAACSLAEAAIRHCLEKAHRRRPDLPPYSLHMHRHLLKWAPWGCLEYYERGFASRARAAFADAAAKARSDTNTCHSRYQLDLSDLAAVIKPEASPVARARIFRKHITDFTKYSLAPAWPTASYPAVSGAAPPYPHHHITHKVPPRTVAECLARTPWRRFTATDGGADGQCIASAAVEVLAQAPVTGNPDPPGLSAPWMHLHATPGRVTAARLPLRYGLRAADNQLAEGAALLDALGDAPPEIGHTVITDSKSWFDLFERANSDRTSVKWLLRAAWRTTASGLVDAISAGEAAGKRADTGVTGPEPGADLSPRPWLPPYPTTNEPNSPTASETEYDSDASDPPSDPDLDPESETEDNASNDSDGAPSAASDPDSDPDYVGGPPLPTARDARTKSRRLRAKRAPPPCNGPPCNGHHGCRCDRVETLHALPVPPPPPANLPSWANGAGAEYWGSHWFRCTTATWASVRDRIRTENVRWLVLVRTLAGMIDGPDLRQPPLVGGTQATAIQDGTADGGPRRHTWLSNNIALRVLLKVHSHQLREQNEARRAGRPPKAHDPGLFAVGANDIVDLAVTTVGKQAPLPEDVYWLPRGALAFHFTVGGRMWDGDGRKLVELIHNEGVTRAWATKDQRGTYARALLAPSADHAEGAAPTGPPRNVSILWDHRHLRYGTASCHTRAFYLNPAYQWQATTNRALAMALGPRSEAYKAAHAQMRLERAQADADLAETADLAAELRRLRAAHTRSHVPTGTLVSVARKWLLPASTINDHADACLDTDVAGLYSPGVVVGPAHPVSEDGPSLGQECVMVAFLRNQQVLACETRRLYQPRPEDPADPAHEDTRTATLLCGICLSHRYHGDQHHMHCVCSGDPALVHDRRAIRTFLQRELAKADRLSGGYLSRHTRRWATQLDAAVNRTRTQNLLGDRTADALHELDRFRDNYPWLVRLQLWCAPADAILGIARSGDEEATDLYYRACFDAALIEVLRQTEQRVLRKCVAQGRPEPRPAHLRRALAAVATHLRSTRCSVWRRTSMRAASKQAR